MPRRDDPDNLNPVLIAVGMHDNEQLLASDSAKRLPTLLSVYDPVSLGQRERICQNPCRFREADAVLHDVARRLFRVLFEA
jgi:hypothetical protein